MVSLWPRGTKIIKRLIRAPRSRKALSQTMPAPSVAATSRGDSFDETPTAATPPALLFQQQARVNAREALLVVAAQDGALNAQVGEV
jgi:hypothetical protein